MYSIKLPTNIDILCGMLMTYGHLKICISDLIEQSSKQKLVIKNCHAAMYLHFTSCVATKNRLLVDENIGWIIASLKPALIGYKYVFLNLL
jgi:hypothetical protein